MAAMWDDGLELGRVEHLHPVTEPSGGRAEIYIQKVRLNAQTDLKRFQLSLVKKNKMNTL